MEILLFEEVERGASAKIQRSYNILSTSLQGLSDSSDEDDCMAPFKSEDGSVCCVCGDTVPILNKLIEHFKTHTDEVYCHLCRTKFERVMSLALHLKNAHPQQSFMCEKCGAFFKCTWHLNGHIEKHRKDAIQVKPVEIDIKETTKHTDMTKTTMGDHSHCASEQAATTETCNAIQNCTNDDTNSTNQAIAIKTETESLPIIDKQNDTFSFSSCPLSQEQEHPSFRLKEENDNKHRLGESTTCEVAAEEEVGLVENDESTDTEDDGNPDSLPPGDTPYVPEEDFCSDLEDSDSRSSSYDHHRNKKRQKKQTPDRKSPANTNPESVNITEKFGFQSDSPFCCYGKFANLEKHMDDCRNKLRLACCLCNMACENEELLLKHMTEKHPTAGYICAYCYNVFSQQDSFKNHVCLRRPTGGMNLPATPVTQLPVVPLSDSSSQVKPSAPALFANQNTIKVIKITQTMNKGSTAPDPPPAGSAKALTVLQASPLVPAKVSDLVPQVVAMPQTLIRPRFPQSSSVARPNVPLHIPSVAQPLMPNPARMTLRIPTASNLPLRTQVPVYKPSVARPLMPNLARVALRMPTPSNPPLPSQVPVYIPSVARPLMSNLARMTLRIPTPSNPPFPTQVVVSFSPTVNVSAPILVSANRPVLRQAPPANIRPVNVPVMTSVACPTLVSALVGTNQPQVPPAQVQAPLQIVAMYVNRSRELAPQKRLEQSWRFKTILPCRHCGAISRQPSLRVRHRYLHRGSRLYRCQCGRSFQRQLHLLRHQVQHAESVRFVCVRCGDTFEGAHKLSCHRQKHRKGMRCAKTKCKAAFNCSCGQMFTRPSALLWHMLKNSKILKRTRKNSV
ncbi:zinc finger protein 628 [Labeo rohita]|uniref:zinc finger protein 628 n=1 Tax=Labeo rohita TaxID=84645 RepID=UPI0021E32524|nr:zinc finger protein 628 [Labeo rohita]XP_050986440.1 zinc finger protein 628 [Labeo rohita]